MTNFTAGRVDPESWSVDGVQLTRQQWTIFWSLYRARRPVQIGQIIHGSSSNTRQTVLQLRRKLANTGFRIETRWGFGAYCLIAAGRDEEVKR